MRLVWGFGSLLLCHALFGQGVVTIYPSPVTVTAGSTQQFVIYNTTSGTGVTWSVNGVAGGSAAYGTISTTGLYTAPAIVPAMNVVTVAAASKPSGIQGTSALTISQPVPAVWSTSPSTFTVGSAVTMSLNGAYFNPMSTVQVNGTMWASTYVNSTTMKASGSLPITGTFAVTVTNPGNGAATSAPVNIKVNAAPAVTVKVTPTAATVSLSGTQQFTATVTNTSNTGVTWTATAGSISPQGLYSAPAVMPPSASVTITSTSMADATRSATASVTLSSTPPPPPIVVTVSPTTANVSLSTTTQFTSTVSGTSNTAVTWKATAGSINAQGLYTAPAAMPASAAVTVTATSQADATKSASAAVTLQSGGGTPNPNNSVDLHASRFLEQAAFGPSPADLTYIHSNTTSTQDGIDAWLTNQFAMAPSVISLPASNSNVSSDTLHRMSTAPDQLRQKMAWVLSQFIVISMNKNIYPDEYVPYQQILAQDAFGNFRTLLYDITVSPQMGQYLDLANSNKAGLGSGANENYARELMQLFTIGLNMLNLDGSPKLDGSGNPIPTYLQPDIVRHAAALTGWTYPTPAGAQPLPNNQPNFLPAVMETREGNHDTSAKTLINGCSPLPANQTVLQDTNGVLDCLFNHPNTAPFVATRLIRFLVTSNPTPGYIQRVAAVFNNNGSGVRGDLKAVLTAILKDPEARQDTVTVDSNQQPYYMLNGAPVSYTPGRLKDPICFIVGFVRAMNGAIPPATIIPWNFVAMGETVNQPPSVFGYFSPLYHLPISPALYGPEFQIYTPTESVEEANMLQTIISMPNSDPTVDLSPWNAAVSNTAALLDLDDQRFFYGRMPAQLRTALATAIDANTDNPSRVFTAIYLAVLAGQYQTQF